MKYLARFHDDKGMLHKREFFASHDSNAHRKAQGIANSNNWKVLSVGKL